MAKNKVVFGDTTIMDITDTTAEAADVALGKVFYGNDGVRRSGTGNYMDKVSNPTADDILVTDANGQAVDSGVSLDDVDKVLVAVYEQTPYADVKAAIDAHKAIVLDMPANNNQFCITFATYTNGGNALMYAIYKMNDKPTLMTVTLTPQNQWTISHTDLQDKLVSGTNIKTINNTSLLGSGNIDVQGGGGDGNVFVIEHGQTPYSDIAAAIEAKKAILIHYDDTPNIAPCLVARADDIGYEPILLVANAGTSYYNFQISPENVWTSSEAFDMRDIGDLLSLTTDNKDNLVNAINEVYEKSGEPFRVKQWANSFSVEIPTCTEDISNTAIPKMVFSIDNVEGADYQIVGMIAYEVFDAASGGNRINCWPVCQFTGSGQKELSVRWMCGGTTRKTARRINAWVLLKHR